MYNPTYLQPSTFGIDPAGRVRVGQGRIWGDYKFLTDKQPTLFDEVTNGTGASAFSKPNVNMTVASDGDYCLRKSFAGHPYRAGFPILCEFTLTNFGTETNVEKEFGYFTRQTTGDYDGGYDGVRIYNDGTTHYLQVWNNGTLTESVARTNWKDSLDGTGPSRKNIDFDNFNIIQFDFLWLGGSAVRFFIFIPGMGLYPFHIISNASVNASVMMQTPVHPIQYGIRSTGGSGTFTQICSAVTSEGLITETGLTRGYSSEQNTVTCAAVTNIYGVLGVRFKEGTRDLVAIMERISLLATTNDDFHHEIRISSGSDYADAAGLSWSDVNGVTGMEFAVGTGTQIFSNGYVVENAYSASNESVNALVTNLDRIGNFFDGTSQELWIAIRPMSINLEIHASATIRVLS
jgi:hypothetical protein